MHARYRRWRKRRLLRRAISLFNAVNKALATQEERTDFFAELAKSPLYEE